MRVLLSISLLLILTACGNNFTEHYIPKPDIVYGNSSFLPPSDDPELIKGTTMEEDDERMGRDGYARIGSATFSASDNAWSALDERAEEQAEKVGADAVIVYRSFKSRTNGAPPPSNENHGNRGDHVIRGTGKNHGSYVAVGRSSWRVGKSSPNGTSWSIGTSSRPLSHSRVIHSRTATFWRRLKPGGLGANFRNLSIAEQRKSGSDEGGAIVAVRHGSAAFEEDILVGDILREVGDTKVVNAASAAAALRLYHGRSVTIVLWRNGKMVEKKIRIPEFKS
ncbi:MAG: hypothetical protein OEU46_19560 [Alphaproteobacteria bacterium]|nr:hypothetical protein [Alphaproteobacteria bacterium]